MLYIDPGLCIEVVPHLLVVILLVYLKLGRTNGGGAYQQKGISFDFIKFKSYFLVGRLFLFLFITCK